METSKSKRIQSEEQWRRHVERANATSGTIKSYCQEEGLSLTSLNYWRQKLKAERHRSGSATPPAVTRSRSRALSAFIPIEVTPVAPVRRLLELPDAAWVADLILHLSAGVGGRRR